LSSNAVCNGRYISKAASSRRRCGGKVETFSFWRHGTDPVCRGRTQH